MNTSLFELFKIGIGPSSSHTVGPMRAALRFITELQHLHQVAHIRAELFGSLAHTGLGHGTDRAILLGLSGLAPDTIDPAAIDTLLAQITTTQTLTLAATHAIPFRAGRDLLFHRDQLYPATADPAHSHPNGMTFAALDAAGHILTQQTFYSVGGGFILSAAELAPDPLEQSVNPRTVPYPFSSAAQLLQIADSNHLSIAALVMRNECALLEAEHSNPTLKPITRPGPTLSPQATTEQRIAASILALWHTMQTCTARGIATEGILPGGLNVRRRAPRLHQRIVSLEEQGKPRDPLAPLDWVSLFAIAVNEENAAGGRVVTAPTNGAAGVIPAIAHYYTRFIAQDLPEARPRSRPPPVLPHRRRHRHPLQGKCQHLGRRSRLPG